MKKIKERLTICGLLVSGSLFLCGWTYTLRTNTPAGTDDPAEADDRMREIKGAFVERLDIDHYFTLSATSTYDTADCGKHRYITFREPNDLTVMAADESALFSKNVSSVTELHWIDESDNLLQLTSGGTINIVSADLLGTLANNTYFTAVDAAGTGTVDLIKADANDVAVVPDNSQTATSAAPTSTTGIANKKYVVDNTTMVPAITGKGTGYAAEESVTFPNGFAMKFGSYTFPDSYPNTVDFSDEGVGDFDNDCVAVFTSQSTSTAYANNIRAYSPSKTGFTITGFTSYTCYWLAIGY